MASKTVTLALAVIIVAVLVFLILWFLNTKKTQETEHHYVSPLSTIEHDVSNFVNGVRHGFTNVLSAGKKYLGLFWGLSGKELGNTVGFIEHGISSVERGAETFVRDVYNTIGLGGILKGLSQVGKAIERPILSEYEKFEKGGANVEKEILGDIEKGIKGLEHFGHENVGKVEHIILPPIEHIGTNIEKGVEWFVNDIKTLLKRF